MVWPDDQPKQIIRQTEYQEEYRNGDILSRGNVLRKSFEYAGMPSKGKPEYEPQEYDSSDGIVPRFRGKSAAKLAFAPQQNLEKLPNCKPTFKTRAPFLLGPYMTEVEPYSHAIHCPMPHKLVQQTAPSTPPRDKDNLNPLIRGTRYDLTSSYQADYCSIQIQPKKICLENNSKDILTSSDFTRKDEAYSFEQKPKCKASKDAIQQWNYAHSLLFCTSHNADYLPPSTHGLICHPTLYHPSEQ